MAVYNLLFSIDDCFSRQLMTTLMSIRQTHPEQAFNIYVLQKEPLKKTNQLKRFCQALDMKYIALVMGGNFAYFEDAPSSKRWPETIYYRLLAHLFLPESLDRILYLDADILVINPLDELFQYSMEGYLYAAASHTSEVLDQINRRRLRNWEIESYFNTGVLLMNLTEIRRVVSEQAIVDYIENYGITLLLPDQDIFNGLYGHQVMSLPDKIYNYDTRFALINDLMGEDKESRDLEWTMENTVILHFCGKDKPWKARTISRFVALYLHYQRLADRALKESKP